MLLFRASPFCWWAPPSLVCAEGFNNIAGGSLPNALGFAGDMDGLTLLIGSWPSSAWVISQFRTRRSLIKHELRAEPFVAFVGKIVVFALAITGITVLLAKSAGGTRSC